MAAAMFGVHFPQYLFFLEPRGRKSSEATFSSVNKEVANHIRKATPQQLHNDKE